MDPWWTHCSELPYQPWTIVIQTVCEKEIHFYFICCYCYRWVASVMSDSVRPHRLQPNRLLCPWDSPGKNTGMDCHFLLQSWKWKVKVKSLSRVRLLATPWTAAYQAPPSMGFSRQEYWSGVPLPSPLPYLGHCYLMSLTHAVEILS